MKFDTLATFFCVILIALGGCSFAVDQLLPPGAVSSEQVSPQTTQLPDATPGAPEFTATNEMRYITGDWRCHTEPAVSSDTLIFLHDGEIVVVIAPAEEFFLVDAGKHLCYVHQEAFR